MTHLLVVYFFFAGGVSICSTLATARPPGTGGGTVSVAVNVKAGDGAERLPLVSMSISVIDTSTPTSVSNTKSAVSGKSAHTSVLASRAMVTSRVARSAIAGLAGNLMV